jgi:cyclopropane-fatty-acyl-phospholipid synthase
LIAEEFASGDPHARIAIAALRLFFGSAYAREFGIQLWEGTRVRGFDCERFVLHVNAPGALRNALFPPSDLAAGRALAAGLLEVDGDLEHAVDTLYRVRRSPRATDAVRLLALLRRLPKTAPPRLREPRLRGKMHSRERDRAAIGFHYDQPVEFYRSFLDRDLVYSCAYWDDGISALEDAQSAKLDYTLRKLRLAPGERLLDIGCGWGALVIRAAQFGARALGITLSSKQSDEARRRIAAAGLAHMARVELRDYRELRGERFDKIVSVGMFEHVGRARSAEYFRAAYEGLRPGGLFLNHAIADQAHGRYGHSAGGFVERFVFPDGELVAIADSLQTAERAGFEVRDVENLREHYARTLRAWVANLERNQAAAIAAGGVVSYRLWRVYLAGSAQGFSSGRLGVYQSLLARPGTGGRVDLPATRRDLYQRIQTVTCGRSSIG